MCKVWGWKVASSKGTSRVVSRMQERRDCGKTFTHALRNPFSHETSKVSLSLEEIAISGKGEDYLEKRGESALILIRNDAHIVRSIDFSILYICTPFSV